MLDEGVLRMVEVIASRMASQGGCLRTLMREVQRASIQASLDRFHGNKTKASRNLNLKRTTFLYYFSRQPYMVDEEIVQ